MRGKAITMYVTTAGCFQGADMESFIPTRRAPDIYVAKLRGCQARSLVRNKIDVAATPTTKRITAVSTDWDALSSRVPVNSVA